jgi:hypothetical protein
MARITLRRDSSSVMAGLIPAIYVFPAEASIKAWMAGINPAMTSKMRPHLTAWRYAMRR